MVDVVSSTPARLWIVRHGQTDWNVEGRVQGHTPTHLNAIGRQQAEQMAEYLKDKPFSAVYSSDLPRAYETAETIAARHALAVTRTPELRERSLGPFEGKTPEELRVLRGQAGLGADLADWTGAPGVEDDETVWQRTQRFLLTLFARHRGADVLVVTHGGLLSRMVFRVLGIAPGTPRHFALGNGMTAVITQRDNQFRLLSYVDLALVFASEPSIDTATAGRGS